MFLDCFKNFNFTIPVDVIAMKSHVDSFLDPRCVPVGILINKLDLILNWIVARLVGMFRKEGGLVMSKLCIPVMFFDPLLHRSPCFPNVDFATHAENPVECSILFSWIDVLWLG